MNERWKRARDRAGKQLRAAQMHRLRAQNKLRDLAQEIARVEKQLRRWDTAIKRQHERSVMTDEQLQDAAEKRTRTRVRRGMKL